MANDLLQMGGAGSAGGLLAAIATFFGISRRLTKVEDTLSNKVVFKETFEALKDDIKEIKCDIREMNKTLTMLPKRIGGFSE